MKRESQKIEDAIKHAWSSASPEQIEAASNRALHNLRARTDVAVEEDRDIAIGHHRFNFRKIAMLSAAAVLLLATMTFLLILRRVPSTPSSVQSLDEAAVNLRVGYTFRSNNNRSTFLKLPDGSRVEMRAQSELSLESAEDGLRIRLHSGGVIVTAAKQASGHLYVQTKDVVVSVVGTIFLVNAEEEGSRVAVIQGEVRIQQGALERKLRTGEQATTNPAMESVPMIKELSWSLNAHAHLALLHQSVALLQQVPAVPPPPAPPVPKWDVVSVKPCPSDPLNPGGRGGGMGAHPGRLNVVCLPAMFMIRSAYVAFANPIVKPAGSIPISGGPTWINSDLYSIEAKTEGRPTSQMIEGPMLQSILEDRFKLRMHRETKEIPVYELTIDKRGLKMEALAEDSCVQYDPGLQELNMREVMAALRAQGGTKPFCGIVKLGRPQPGKPARFELDGMSLDEIAANLRQVVDRPVINKTGLAGLYNFVVTFAPDPTTSQGTLNQGRETGLTPSDDTPTGGVSIFKALQEQLGLKLEPAKGPGEFLVIDGIERPSEN